MPVISQAVPELPVRSVRAAQSEYRDKMGFEVAWTREDDGIGAVAHGDCAIFFRELKGSIAPVTLWLYCPAIGQAFRDMTERGASIVAPLAVRPWGLRQFTLRDGNGHILHFHTDDLDPAPE